jgi:hypothetical protein
MALIGQSLKVAAVSTIVRNMDRKLDMFYHKEYRIIPAFIKVSHKRVGQRRVRHVDMALSQLHAVGIDVEYNGEPKQGKLTLKGVQYA